MRFYCQLCGFIFESDDSVNCPNCGSYHLVEGGSDLYD